MKKNFFNFLFTPNALGYGQFYWNFYAFIGSFLGVRIFSSICILWISFIIFSFRKVFNVLNFGITMYALFIWISSNFAWFSGKIIGPEMLGAAIGITGVWLCFMKKRIQFYWGYFLIGISIGIKSNNVIFAVFIIAFTFFPYYR